MLPACEALLKSDRLRPAFLVDALRARIVAADELQCVDPELGTLRNLNTPEDYQSARVIIAGYEIPTPHVVRDETRLPRVHVELFGVPRLRAGTSQVAVEAGDIGEALLALSRACPAFWARCSAARVRSSRPIR